MERTLRPLTAAAPEPSSVLRICAGEGSVELVAAEGANGQAGLPKFKMNVYNGGPMSVGGFGRVIIDLAGLQIPERPLPAFRDHDPRQIVGHGLARIQGGKVLMEGEVSGAGAVASEVRESSKNGFPWQASIGASPMKVEEVKAGASVKVNGKTVQGPILVIRQAQMREASFVPLGADSSTSSRVAASQKESDMGFEAWLRAQGFDPEQLTEVQRKTLQAAYDAEQAAAKKTADGDGTDKSEVQAAESKAPSAEDLIKAERQRVSAIEAACKGEWSKDDQAKVEAIRAKAIAEGQDVAAVNAELLKLLRASRPHVAPVGIVAGSNAPEANVLEAAMVMGYRVVKEDKDLVAAYGEKVCEAARKLRNIRLVELIAACAALDGIDLPRFGRGSGEWLRAAFSSVSLPGILGNVANKTLLAAYQSVPSVARRICRISQVSDFKTHTRYRLTGNMTFEKVTAGGELAHGQLGEQSFSQKADTYGKYFQLTRQDVVNDDLSAFLQIPALIGRGAAVSIEEIVFTLILANTGSFFGSGNANIYANAAAGLGDAALSVMVQKMRDQTDANGKPILIEPKYLLTPTALATAAERIYKGQNLVVTALGATDAAAILPDVNTHAGKYEPLSSPYLSNASFHANASSVDWYLFADPNVLAAFEIAFLNGVDTPVVEQVEVPANVLGIGFRGYQDMGAAAMDPRGAAKADVG